ncbi:unnamed protein product, partial [marine sediment metagenome]
MVIPRPLITLVSLELDVVIVVILIDVDVGIYLGKMVSHFSYFVEGV